MWVDDSAWTLLTASFIILVAASCQLIGWWGAWWTSMMLGCFFSAILVQMYNYYADNLGESVQINTQVYSLLAVLVGTVLLSKLIGAITSVVAGGLQLGLVILLLAWGYNQVSGWTESQLGWDMSLWAYVLIVLFLGLLLFLALRHVAGWRWFSRIFNVVLVTFIVTQAARVIAERDPYHSFGTTQIEVLDFDTVFFAEWAGVTAVYCLLYYLAYKHLPWHHERHVDMKDKVYKEHLKAEQEAKQAIRKAKKEEKARVKKLKEMAKAESEKDSVGQYLLDTYTKAGGDETTTPRREGQGDGEGEEGGAGATSGEEGSTLLYPEMV